MRYECLLWDVDGTLLDFEYSQRYAISRCLEEIHVPPTEEKLRRYSQINEGYWKRLELGEITKEQLLSGRFLSLFEEFQIECRDVDAFRAAYQEYLGNVYQYIENGAGDNSLAICKRLWPGYRQFVVTNGVASTQLHKLQLSGFSELMEDIFISEDIGAAKPQKKFFDVCLERMGAVDKSHILIIGDSLSSDIRGGNLAGIDTCWYNPDGQPVSDIAQSTYEINSLSQLFDILEDTGRCRKE